MKWMVRVDEKGREHRFPYNAEIAEKNGWRVVDDEDERSAEPAAPAVEIAQQTHPETVRESSPMDDVVAAQDEVQITLKRPPNRKVKA